MATATESEVVPSGTWQADTVHSSVSFQVLYAVSTFSGEVPDFEARLVDGTLTGTARIASIVVKEENLEAHLLSPEFFDAEQFPEVSFTSRAASREGDAVRFDGELTMKGVTQPVVLRGTVTGPAVDHFGATRLGLELETTADRTAFGMTWNMPLPDGKPALANEVTLHASLTLVQQ